VRSDQIKEVNVRILFFGATAGVVGQRSVDMEFPENSSAIAAVDRVKEQFPGLKKHRLLCALNQNYISGIECLHEGDEVAIFTAVSGG
jgi:molybdopterin converting factor small subunit